MVPRGIQSILLPKLRNRFPERRVLNRHLPLDLVLLQLVYPRRHVSKSRLGQTRKVNHEAARLSFEGMFEFVIVDPFAWHPDDARRIRCFLVIGLYCCDHFGHSSLLAKPSEIVFRVRERVVDDFGEEIDGRWVHSKVEDAVVQAVVVCCHESIDVYQVLWG